MLTTIQVKQNLSIVARERGKIVARRDGHNIWVNLGREYLASLIAYSALGPPTTYRDDRIRYMGLGIGGTRQTSLGVANGAPYSTAYPGTNAQTDVDVAVSVLERPVRISGGTTAYPGQASDVWLADVVAPPVFTEATMVKFTRIFTGADVSYSTFTAVPTSEIGLFTNAANVNVYNNTLVAYDTFDTISKTSSFEFEVNWTIRF